jgi:hypothetical protein
MQSFRQDLEIRHDARGFVLASSSLAGRDCRCESGDPRWLALVAEGIFLPVEMSTKRGATVLRVLLGKELSAQEQEECYDRFAWRLRIPDGQFTLIGGGREYLTDSGRADAAGTAGLAPGETFKDEGYLVRGWGDPIAVLGVPPGDYRVDLHACFTGVNGPDYIGEDCRDPQIIPEPLGAWFRRTRPGLDLPAWIWLACYEDPGSDPGHEEEYDDETFDYDAVDERAQRSTCYDYIVQLTPLEKAPALPHSPPLLDEGWVPTQVQPRLLEKCPLGFPRKGRRSGQAG